MGTITTKQLRENMPQVIRDLKRGQSVQLSYRHKVIGVLQPVQSVVTPTRRGSAKAVQNFLESSYFGPVPRELRDSSLTVKQQIAELRKRDLDTE